MVNCPLPKLMIMLVVEGEVESLVEASQGEVDVVHLCSKSKRPLHYSPMLNFSSIPVTRTVGKVSAAATLSIPTGPSSNRPLDPAIDPTREYAYKSRRGGKTFTMSYNGGPAVRVVPALARGKTPNDARATMEGSTVRISPATLSDANSESSKPPRAPRV